MVRVKVQLNKNDIRTKSKRKEKSEEYLKYQRYIRSKEFKVVKDIVHKRCNETCQTCHRTAEDVVNNKKISFNVHHTTYRHLYEGGELEAADCILLCSCCHRAIHSAKSNIQRFKK